MIRRAVIFAIGLVVAVAATASAALPEAVKTETGLVSGVAGTAAPAVTAFKGIPFAAPPVGQNRWREPQPPARWRGVRKADAFGNRCISGVGFGAGRGAAPARGRGQAGRAAAPAGPPPQPPASEDCLYLNVWTSATRASDKRPVMVWIYGGGFTGGSGSEPRYDGERLAAKGPVVVTFNYRLGQFGFFAHPELTKASPHHASGNYGMMDAIAALGWVNRNIAAFGGDPDNVTIFGESAGAIMIGGLVGSPHAKGLFKRAIGQSGAWMGLTMARMTTLRQQEDAGAQALTAMGVASIAALRTRPTADVAAGLKPPTALIVDGYLIPEDLSLTYAEGRQNTVDVLVGSNKDEAMFFLGLGGGAATMTAASYTQQLRQRFGSRGDDLFKLYPARDDSDAVPAYVASYGAEVSWAMRTWAESEAKKGKKAFVYSFTRVPRQADGAPSPRGAMHTVEIQYAFDNPTGLHWNDVDARLADMMSSYWVNFATKGDPNGPGLPLWPAYTDKTSGRALVLGDTVQVETAMPPALTLFDAAYGSLLAGGTN